MAVLKLSKLSAVVFTMSGCINTNGLCIFVVQELYARRKQAQQLPPSTVSSSDSAVFLQVCTNLR